MKNEISKKKNGSLQKTFVVDDSMHRILGKVAYPAPDGYYIHTIERRGKKAIVTFLKK